MWNEIATPLLLAEWVSGNGDEERDTTTNTGKFWVYERGIRAAYYLIYDPYSQHLEVFELIRGRYQPLVPNAEGRFRIPAMALEFGIWRGFYHNLHAPWLRAWDLNGVLIPTDHELAERYEGESRQERLRADLANRRANTAMRQFEEERIRAEVTAESLEEERTRAEVAMRQADEEHTRADEERTRADEERTRAEAANQQAEAERTRAEAAVRQADEERTRAVRLAAKLRELGIDPDAV